MPDSHDPRLSRRALISSTLLATATGTTAAQSNNSSSTNSTEDDPEPTNENENENEDEDYHATRIVHFVPDAGELNISVSGHREWPSMQRFHKSEYKDHRPGGTYTFTLTEASSGDVVIEETLGLGSGTHTLALLGERCTTSDRPIDLVATKDDYRDIPEGQARFKPLHASPDAPALEIRLDDTDEVLVEDLEFATSDVIDIPADGSKQIISVHEAATGDELARFPVEPTAGSVYSAFAVGYLNPDAAPSSVSDPLSFALGVSEDMSPAEQ